MFGTINSQWIAGTALALSMVPGLAGVGATSAQDTQANQSVESTTSATQLTANSSTTVASGTILTIDGSGYGANEAVGLWINVPNDTVVPEESLGQSETEVVGTVIPIDAMVYADDQGAMSYNLDTSGLPNGTYSVVAHGVRTETERVFSFTIAAVPAIQLTASGDNTTIAAGTMLTIGGSGYANDEAVGLWINAPTGTTIPEVSLGQEDTQVVGSVIPVNAPGYADDKGALTCTLDTTGLPSGTYSLVARGLESGLQGEISFTIN